MLAVTKVTTGLDLAWDVVYLTKLAIIRRWHVYTEEPVYWESVELVRGINCWSYVPCFEANSLVVSLGFHNYSLKITPSLSTWSPCLDHYMAIL